MSFKVLSSGYYTTIQDEGRSGYRRFGIPVSGAIDLYSFYLANQILNNPKTTAVLECTLLGPTLLIQKPISIAITGAKVNATLNNKEIPMYSSVFCKVGDVLSIGKVENRVRTYIAFEGGIVSEKIFKSQSFCYPITPIKKLEKGMIISFYFKNTKNKKKYLIKKIDYNINKLKCNSGPEWPKLHKKQKDNINNPLTVSANNRMGYRMESTFYSQKTDIHSALVLPGTVQLTPSGNCLIAMPDCQITGGYYRIAQLTEESIAILAQKKVGEKIYLKMNS